MAKLAEQAGFKAIYLSGGSLGYLKGTLEANLFLPELMSVGIDIRSVCDLPIILDAACGWGDPMHMHRTVALAEAAGFAAIEIEDQVFPKRAHHHTGVNVLISKELMVDKIREAAAARSSNDFVIIGRTDAVRTAEGMEGALRRGGAYREAGADILLFTMQTYGAEETRLIGKRLGGPLMYGAREGLSSLPMPLRELRDLGYVLVAEAATPLFAMFNALKETYAAMAEFRPDPLVGSFQYFEFVKKINSLIGADKLVEIEKRTVLAGH